MNKQPNGPPVIPGKRLVLRPFVMSDAPAVATLAGDADVAATALSIPHPYDEGMAVGWIRTHESEFEHVGSVNLAVELVAVEGLIGAISLTVDSQHELAELGYWIGKPYWGNGYGTEAARMLIQYGFTAMGLNRIEATYLPRNVASGRVLEKVGMQREGLMRQCIKDSDRFEDRLQYAILKEDWTLNSHQ